MPNTERQMETIEAIEAIDDTIIDAMADSAIPLLRMSLGVTYIWFGALKLVNASPVSDLVVGTVPFLPRKLVMPILGVWEVALGLALLFRVALRPTMLFFFLQLAGTFMTFVLQPKKTFKDNNPLLLTKDGEFVIKNLVLLSAGLAIGSTARRKREALPNKDTEFQEEG